MMHPLIPPALWVCEGYANDILQRVGVFTSIDLAQEWVIRSDFDGATIYPVELDNPDIELAIN